MTLVHSPDLSLEMYLWVVLHFTVAWLQLVVVITTVHYQQISSLVSTCAVRPDRPRTHFLDQSRPELRTLDVDADSIALVQRMAFSFSSFETGHTDFMHDIAYDFYGTRLATCSSDKKITVPFILANCCLMAPNCSWKKMADI